MKSIFFQKGVSIYLAFMLMLMLLVLALAVSAVLLSELKITKGIGYSVIAFYAADTGIERMVFDDVQCWQQTPPCQWFCKEDTDEDGFCQGVKDDYEPAKTLANGAKYEIDNIVNGFRSVGIYKGVRRAIEVIY